MNNVQNLRNPEPVLVTRAREKAAALGLSGTEADAYVRRQCPGYVIAPTTTERPAGTDASASDVYARRANRAAAEPATKLPDADSVYATRAEQAKRRAAGIH